MNLGRKDERSACIINGIVAQRWRFSIDWAGNRAPHEGLVPSPTSFNVRRGANSSVAESENIPSAFGVNSAARYPGEGFG